MADKEELEFRKKVKNTKVNLKYKGRGRPSKLVADERMKVVVEMVMKGNTRHEIITHCEKEFGISVSAIDNLTLKCNKYIRENYNHDPLLIINTHINKYQEIIKDWDGVDPKAQIAALQAIEKLLRLHNADVLVQNNTLKLDLKDMTVNQLKELLKQ